MIRKGSWYIYRHHHLLLLCCGLSGTTDRASPPCLFLQSLPDAYESSREDFHWQQFERDLRSLHHIAGLTIPPAEWLTIAPSKKDIFAEDFNSRETVAQVQWYPQQHKAHMTT
ncbi:hypothetical protein FRB94_010099 [Tulasnella sp. JGI-2019a]|nr:hypothetical protein FRB94_010099 [Tulasnella sp. JGI-2019a]